MNKFKLFFKATWSCLFNHMADYEDAYDEGWNEGQQEGWNEGWAQGKTDAERLWRDLYKWLNERKLLDPDGESNAFDMMESLHEYENDLKRANKYWRNDAFRVAGEIVDRYVTSGLADAQLAKDIKALINDKEKI